MLTLELWVTIAGVLISGIAVIVAIIALRASKRTANRQTQLQEQQTDLQRRVTEIEEAREKDRQAAKTKASLIPSLPKECNDHYLLVRNKSPAEARDIDITLDGMPLQDHRVFVPDQELVRKLGANNSFHYGLTFASGSFKPLQIKITWTDDSGEPGIYETTLVP